MLPYKKYKMWIETGFANGTHRDVIDVPERFSKAEWNAMSEDEKESFLNQELEDFVCNTIESGWSEND